MTSRAEEHRTEAVHQLNKLLIRLLHIDTDGTSASVGAADVIVDEIINAAVERVLEGRATSVQADTRHTCAPLYAIPEELDARATVQDAVSVICGRIRCPYAEKGCSRCMLRNPGALVEALNKQERSEYVGLYITETIGGVWPNGAEPPEPQQEKS